MKASVFGKFRFEIHVMKLKIMVNILTWEQSDLRFAGTKFVVFYFLPSIWGMSLVRLVLLQMPIYIDLTVNGGLCLYCMLWNAACPTANPLAIDMKEWNHAADTQMAANKESKQRT